MLRAGFDPTTPVDERSQTYVLDPAATGTGNVMGLMEENVSGEYLKLRKKKRLGNGVNFKMKSASSKGHVITI
jgi:hypothetical protein